MNESVGISYQKAKAFRFLILHLNVRSSFLILTYRYIPVTLQRALFTSIATSNKRERRKHGKKCNQEIFHRRALNSAAVISTAQIYVTSR